MDLTSSTFDSFLYHKAQHWLRPGKGTYVGMRSIQHMRVRDSYTWAGSLHAHRSCQCLLFFCTCTFTLLQSTKQTSIGNLSLIHRHQSRFFFFSPAILLLHT
ncbi:hypothetical protein DM02DRAFT_208341 [Periconia macrospinosa]|uniref:Uncharacterized protein n=1 Tax=Periconia macrospinosa TaxID=97972 RepID=A0A2V1E3G9_9PLEO|nr:hypothetical protein DM02DRAFT_208341 [Periconia macrospinosa]